jgi:hypothetical protein
MSIDKNIDWDEIEITLSGKVIPTSSLVYHSSDILNFSEHNAKGVVISEFMKSEKQNNEHSK